MEEAMEMHAQPSPTSLRPLYRSRLVRPERFGRVRATAVPETRLLARALPAVEYSDAYAVSCPGRPPGDPQEWADAFFRAPPAWVVSLLGVREALVRLVGIESADGHAFDTVDWNVDEVLVGIDQAHLSFRASILLEDRRVVLTTVVRVHNARGRAYWALVRWIHPLVIRAMLARAYRTMGTTTAAGATTVPPRFRTTRPRE
jgi:hypothetical protein